MRGSKGAVLILTLGLVVHGFYLASWLLHYRCYPIFAPLVAEEKAPRSPLASTGGEGPEVRRAQERSDQPGPRPNARRAGNLTTRDRETPHARMDRYFLMSWRLDPSTDFFQVYYAARSLLAGDSIYQWTYRPGEDRFHPSNVYPPLVVALVGAPLRLLRPNQAAAAWAGLHEILLALVALGSWRLLRPRHPAWAAGAAALWLAAPLYYIDLYHGQFSFPVAAGIFGLLWWDHHGRPARGAAAWTAATQIKIAPLLFAPAFWAHRRRRAVLINLGLLVGSMALYFAFHPADLSYFWERTLAPRPAHAANLAGVLGILTRSAGVTRLLSALFLGGCLGLTWLGRRASLHHLVGLWTTTILLTYSRTWNHHHLLAFPLVVFLLREEPRPIWLLLGAWLAVPVPNPVWTSLLHWPLRTWRLAEAMLFSIPLLLLFGAYVRRVGWGSRPDRERGVYHEK